MKLFYAFSVVASLLGAAHGASIGDERQVALSLDQTLDSHVILTAPPNSNGLGQTLIDTHGKGTGTANKILESFGIEKESLSEEQMEILEGGGTLKASVKPIRNFRIRDSTSLQPIDVTAEEADQQIRKLSAATLWGGAIARGLMSVSFDGGETSLDASTSYSRVEAPKEPTDEFMEAMGERRLYTCLHDICGSLINPNCYPINCRALVPRGVRKTELRCEAGNCEKRLAAVTVVDPVETETQEYEGMCEKIYSEDGSGEYDCECALSGQTAIDAENWVNDIPPIECTNQKCAGQTNGDPHFKTFDGKKYDFHGECDLVATSSPTFANNKGLDIHIRTTIKDTWSKITGAAIRIGDDIFEIDALDAVKKLKFVKTYFNKQPVTGDNLPSTIGGLPFQKLDEDGVLYKITVNDHEEILISSFSGMVKVRVHAHMHDAAGMLGTRATPGLIGRDGETKLSPLEMGEEWQVRPEDHPILFSTSRAPQYPAGCVMPPEPAARRLGQDSALRRMAEGACEGIEDPEEIDDCIFDVIQTGDANMALDYH